MQRVIHFSGGKSSARMTLLLEPTDNDIVLFTDTGREHPGTYKFIEDFEQHEGIKVHTATYTHHKAPGLTGMDALIEYKKFLPRRTQRICTAELKLKTARRYLRSLGLRQYQSFVGFRVDEPHRMKERKQRWKTVTEHFPLAEAGINKAMVDAFWASKPYTLGIPSILGNCDCCFMKGKNALITIFQHFPELADRWIADEQKITARGQYKKPAQYVEAASMSQLLEAAKMQGRLFDLEKVLPAFNCSCTT